MDTSTLSVVFCVRDHDPERVRASVESLRRCRVPDSLSLRDIIISDYGSTDPDVCRAYQDIPGTQYVRSEGETWRGGAARNRGAMEASGDWVAFLDDGVVLSATALEVIGDEIENHPDGTFILRPYDLPAPLSVDEALTQTDIERLLAGARRQTNDASNIVVQRAGMMRIGGYDERGAARDSDDLDFALRMARAGCPIVQVTNPAGAIFSVPEQKPTSRLLDKPSPRAERKLPTTAHSVFKNHISGLGDAPVVSIVIATHAREFYQSFLRRCLSSIHDQSYRSFEIVLISNGDGFDGGLVDDLRREFPDLALVHQHNARASIAEARNAGTDLAQGEFICVMDDDDIMLPDRLADHIAALDQAPRAAGSFGGRINFDEDTGAIEFMPGRYRSAASLLFQPGDSWNHSCMMVRKDALQVVRYDERLRSGSDMDNILRLALNEYLIVHTGTYVTCRRVHGENISWVDRDQQQANGQTIRALATRRLPKLQIEALKEDAKLEEGLLTCSNFLVPSQAYEFLVNDIRAEMSLVVSHAMVEALPLANREMAIEMFLDNGFELIALDSGFDPDLGWVMSEPRRLPYLLALLRRLEGLGLTQNDIWPASHREDRLNRLQVAARDAAANGDIRLIGIGPFAGALEAITERAGMAAEPTLRGVGLKFFVDAPDDDLRYWIAIERPEQSELVEHIATIAKVHGHDVTILRAAS